MPWGAVDNNGHWVVCIAIARVEPSSALPLPVKVSSRNWCDFLPPVGYLCPVLCIVSITATNTNVEDSRFR